MFFIEKILVIYLSFVNECMSWFVIWKRQLNEIATIPISLRQSFNNAINDLLIAEESRVPFEGKAVQPSFLLLWVETSHLQLQLFIQQVTIKMFHQLNLHKFIQSYASLICEGIVTPVGKSLAKFMVSFELYFVVLDLMIIRRHLTQEFFKYLHD